MLLNQALAPKNFNFSRSQALRSWTCGQLLLGQLGQLPSPETNEFAPENRPGPNRKRSYSNHPFSGAMLVSGRVMGWSKLGHLPPKRSYGSSFQLSLMCFWLRLVFLNGQKSRFFGG